MAYDFIQGNTGSNWARGIKQLLPDTPDSTSMGKATPVRMAIQHISGRPEEDEETYWDKLQRDMENIRQNVWRGPYPMVLDADSVSSMLVSPGLTNEQISTRRAGFSRLLNSEKVILSDGGRRVRLTDTHASIISTPTRSVASGGLNDDELAVARDGGSSEMSSLARMRGCSAIGKGSPSRQLAAAHASYAIASRRQQATQAAPDGSDDLSPQGSSSSSKSSNDDQDNPSKDSGLNDDEQEVAMDGGACEMDALARMRGEFGRTPGFFPDVNSRPIKLYACVSSTNDLTRPYRKQTGPSTWRTSYRPNSGKHRRRNYKVVRVNPVKFIRV